ncbi:hypothetical protein [Georgenia alba]|uniref:Uncharacterized protein n=1 Tax=Georgenia alba TaxID=2233858 RepID=A0ABW2Q763_9MICO
MRGALSLVLAAVAVVVAAPLAAHGGYTVLMQTRAFLPAAGYWWLALATLLLVLASASVALSWIGAVVVGAVQVALSVVVLVLSLVPTELGAVAFQIMGHLSEVLGGGSVGHGLTAMIPLGTWLVTGTIMVGGGIAARWRDQGARRNAALPVAGLLALGAGLALVLHFGHVQYEETFVHIRTPALPMLMLLTGALLVGAGVVATRWGTWHLWPVIAVTLLAGFLPLLALNVAEWLPGWALANTALALGVPFPVAGALAGLAVGLVLRRRLGGRTAHGPAGPQYAQWSAGQYPPPGAVAGQYPPPGQPQPSGSPPYGSQPYGPPPDGYPSPDGYSPPGQTGPHGPSAR